MGHRARFKPRIKPTVARPEAPVLPSEAEAIWLAWRELDATRASAFDGIEPITHQEIGAYGRNVGDALAPWEVRALIAVDASYRRIMREPAKTVGG